MRQSAAYDRSLLVGAPHLTNAERQVRSLVQWDDVGANKDLGWL